MHLVDACASTAHRDVHHHVDKEELVAWGTTGLLEAAERYDPELGTTFVTFAYYRIRGAIYDGLRKMGSLPHHYYRRVVAAQRASEYLEDAERQARPRERALLSPPDTTATLRELYDVMRSVALVAAVSFDNDDPPEPLIDSDGQADVLLAQKQLHARLQRAIVELPDKERHFIEKCYYEGKSVTAAGRMLGLSKSWSSRLHARAVDRLRDLLGQGRGTLE